MTLEDFLKFTRRHQFAVEASVAVSGSPQAAVIGFVVSDEFELFFDTLGSSRKAANLRHDARIALVIGWDLQQAQTLQLQGVADQPSGDDLARLQALYFEAFPDGRERLAWPDLRYYRVRPTWLRLSDFSGAAPVITELTPTGSTWDAGQRVLETRLSGDAGVAEVERWRAGLAAELARLSDGMEFKLLSDVNGFEPSDMAAHRAMRTVVPELLAAHGMRPALLAEASRDEAATLTVAAKPKAKCVAHASVHHDPEKMRDLEARLGNAEQRFFSERGLAERWLYRDLAVYR